MRMKALGANGAGVARPLRHVGHPADHQAAADGSAGLEESARRETDSLDGSRIACVMTASLSGWRTCARLLDGFADAHIGAAAADVAGHRRVDVGVGRVGDCWR